MKKSLSVLVFLLFFLLPVYSLTVYSTVQSYLLIPQESLCAAGTLEFRFSDADFHFDPYFGLGWSMRYFHEGESRALIYGPVLRFGISAVKETRGREFKLSLGEEGAYSNFPTPVYIGCEATVNRIAQNGIRYGISAAVMNWDNVWSFKFAYGVSGRMK